MRYKLHLEFKSNHPLYMQLFHSICRIAEVLINLQQVGNVKYTGWILKVPCHINPQDPSDTNIISDLRDQAKIMEDELSDWKKMVKEKRRDFYELNYFSTLQLLTLRKELGTVKNSRAVVPPNVITLLQSISSQITSDLVCDVVHGVASKPIAEAKEDEDVIEDDVHVLHQYAVPLNAVPLKDEIMASADQQTSANRTVSHDLPNITEDDLSLDEKAIMDYIIQRLSCSKLLILKALETYRDKEEEWNKYDIQTWCNNNANNFVFDDDEEEGDFAHEEGSESEGSYSSDSDSVRSNDEFTYSQECKFC